MVRRLKEDIRDVQGGFPKRNVVRVSIDGLPGDAPELALSRLLDEYREAREERFEAASKSARAASGPLVVGLQQRLLSSIEAFARSLKTHRNTLERRRRKAAAAGAANAGAGGSFAEDQAGRFVSASWLAGESGDEDRAAFIDEEAEREEQDQIRDLNAAAELDDGRSAPGNAGVSPASGAGRLPGSLPRLLQRENDLLDRMQRIAEHARGRPDAKTRELVDWIREHLCHGLPSLGKALPAGEPPPRWNNRRLLIFTENREGTKRYLRSMLDAAIAATDRAEERIVTIDGLTRGPRRREIQRRFNADPKDEPLRILLATDAAREGLNFQAHCTDLFHFDLPWNPGRIEQRNGRIDRKLQPAHEVRCHYFVLPQRAEDRVLQVLVRKTETIKTELGSLSQVIHDSVERRLTKTGIRHRDAERLAREIKHADIDAERRRIANEELEAARQRRDELKGQITRCQDLLQRSRKWVQFEVNAFRDALSCSTELVGAKPLRRTRSEDSGEVWTFPTLDGQTHGDPTWAGTLDSLRRPRRRHQKLTEWRKEEPPRPVVFEDAGILTDVTVHLHLEQRVAQRLLARFRSQGFVHHDLSRACLAQSADSIPRVVLLGRLTLYGRGAERLHEEVVTVAARWVEPTRRNAPLAAYARDAEIRALDLLEQSLARSGSRPVNEVVIRRLLGSASRDIDELRPQLEARASAMEESATERLRERGERESRDLRETLESQRKHVGGELARRESALKQRTLAFSQAEERQLTADTKSAPCRRWSRSASSTCGRRRTDPAALKKVRHDGAVLHVVTTGTTLSSCTRSPSSCPPSSTPPSTAKRGGATSHGRPFSAISSRRALTASPSPPRRVVPI